MTAQEKQALSEKLKTVAESMLNDEQIGFAAAIIKPVQTVIIDGTMYEFQ